MKCHGKDGTGKPGRAEMDQIPDFTDSSWQKKRSDDQLLKSILEGKDPDMPRWGGKFSEEQARGLVAHVRTFAHRQGQSEVGSREAFSERFHRLQEEFDKLQRQGEKRSEESPGNGSTTPSQSPGNGASRPLASTTAGAPAAREVFQKHCVKCHGEDGTGKPARAKMDEIPDFTDSSWQKKRSDAQLLKSILEGKEPDMPSWRGKIDEERARGLVAHVRTFARSQGKTEGSSRDRVDDRPHRVARGREEATPSRSVVVKTPRAFFTKLIAWLGTFHPPAVHFPIALLTAAAVAELLRLTTGQTAFDTVSRFLVWFGGVTAIIAGVLGWSLGGFRLTDPSRLLMTHRWLGTTTAACAGALLLQSEVSRRSERHRARVWFRVLLFIEAVLVSVTGFLGGGLVFGLDYHDWAR
jgi:mono/diheme cytochrome c family protein/uncharacterized membrane protein